MGTRSCVFVAQEVEGHARHPRSHAPAAGGPGSVWDGHARGSGTGSLPSNSVINPKDQLSINFDVNFGNYNALSGSNVYKNYQLIVKTENTPLIYLSSKLTFGRV